MGKNLSSFIDWTIIIAGSAAVVLALSGVIDSYLKWPVAIFSCIAVCYLVRAIFLFIRRPHFDWHLVNGNFLRKTCSIILLMPFVLTGISMLVIDSPKELTYDENLYGCHDRGVPDEIRNKQEDPNLFWSTYYHFIDPGNQHMTTSPDGRRWAAIIGILGIFLLNGLLVSSIVGWIDSRKEKWLKGEVRYPWFLRCKRHYVIIGGNDMTLGVVRQIFEKHDKKEGWFTQTPYILIQTSGDVEALRRELYSMLTRRQQQHLMIFYGSRTSPEDVGDLFPQKAMEIYILGEQTRTDEIEPYHDTFNMQCLDRITRIAQEAGNIRESIRCYVMFEYQTSFAAFQSSKLNRTIISTGTEEQGNYRELLSFIPFSPYESWAQTVLVKGKVEMGGGDTVTYRNIDEDGISYESEKRVHVIIVGMSKMGTALAIETAHLAHFPNFVRDNSRRTKITFIDPNAREESDFFIGRFPDMFKLCRWTDVDGKVHNEHGPECHEYKYFKENFLDIEWEFREGGVESAGNREFLESCFKENRNDIITIAVCLPWPHQSLASALYLPKVAIHKANDIWVYQPQSGKMLQDINKNGNCTHSWDRTTYSRLKPFGMLSHGFDSELLENDAIWYCDTFYKAKDALKEKFEKEHRDGSISFSEFLSIKKVEEAIPNISPSLGKLWAVWSNIYQINTIKFKCRSLGSDFSALDNNSCKLLFAEVEHNRWNVEKLLMGYKPLGDHILDADEIKTIREYLKTRHRVEEDQLEKVQEGINEKDIYYNWRTGTFMFKKVKGFYKDGPMKVHPNICPFRYLPADDKDYDICFTLAMPFLRKKADNTEYN